MRRLRKGDDLPCEEERHGLVSISAALLTNADAMCGKVRALQVGIEKAKLEKMSLWEQLHGGDVSREKYRKESDRLTARITGFENEITALEADIEKLELESGQENLFVERYSKVSNIQSLTREIVNELVKEIRVYAPNRIEIMMNYADEFEKLQQDGGF